MDIKNNKAQTILAYMQQHLATYYVAEEIQSFFYLLLEHYSGVTKLSYFANRDIKLTEWAMIRYVNAVKRLQAYEPVQYIIGHTHFADYIFKVSPAVLIPRPETEELVNLIIEENIGIENLTILDICTGSGCIAISLQKKLNANVWATDVSVEALAIAKQNNEDNNASVDFILSNVLENEFDFLNEKLDVVVSNPPYVPINEADTMDANVIKYEPHIALFVPNTNAMLFYTTIAKKATQYLKVGGRLYFECHTDYAAEVAFMLPQFGYNSCTVLNDINNKPRFVRAIKN